METSVIKLLSEGGINTIGLVAFVWFAMQAQKTHREERAEWRQERDLKEAKMESLISKHFEVIDSNTEVIRGVVKAIDKCNK